ncbi:MAG: hypothetical protein KA188_08850 [Leadbetterella sp.]|jgi:hypothetical protein|nr:hypothetical protein [Leadbetterella sp.]
MELSVLRKSGEGIKSINTTAFSKFRSQKFTISCVVVKNRTQRLFILAFLLVPFLSFSNPPSKRAKKTKTVKTIRRNILEVEFGTFRYESPVMAKKSVFLG